MTDLINGDYTALLGEIKDHIRSAQYEALRAVNKQLIALYWDIGRLIVERQETKGWGLSIVDQLAADVQQAPSTLSGWVRGQRASAGRQAPSMSTVSLRYVNGINPTSRRA